MKIRLTVIGLVAILALLSGCMRGGESASQTPEASGKAPQMPAGIELVEGIPQLSVYNVASKSIERMDIETYVQGVLAGEMRNDWPIEALKAQAILARTFVLNFVDEKESRYDGADISTDVSEAQAYDASSVNERIREAVKQTNGLVLVNEGRFPQAWFHAHAGGMTELPSKALEYKKGDPPYVQAVKSPESRKAPEDVKRWTATFTAEQVARACADSGVSTGKVTSIEIGDKGESGRAVNLIVNGKEVSAPAVRINIGASKMKSTLIEDISLKGDQVTITGSGYGHGVGLSQWGAYGMAEEGRSAEEIVLYYFKNVEIVKQY